MKCDLVSGIGKLSGKSGGVQFRTYRKPDGTTETRAYLLPRKENGKYGYTRRTAVTKDEKQRRILFAQASMYAGQVITDIKSPEFVEWYNRFKQTKGEFNGKKYASLRGFIMAVYFAERKDIS